MPKTRNADDVKRLDWKISELEARRGIPAGTVKIAVLLETAEGIMNAYSICTASPRIVAAFFGAVDYCCDMRITRTNLAEEQKVARTIVAIAAVRPGSWLWTLPLRITPTWTISVRTPWMAVRWALRAA